MTALKIARASSILVWGALGLLFGAGAALAGIRALPSPGGWLALLVGLVIMAIAYGLHRATCLGLSRLFRPRTS